MRTRVTALMVTMALATGVIAAPAAPAQVTSATATQQEGNNTSTPVGGSSNSDLSGVKETFNLLLALVSVGGFLAILAKVLGDNITLPRL